MSRMVANAGLGHEATGLSILRQTTGKGLPTTTTKLRPRNGATALWRFELSELIAGLGLSDHHADLSPPTIDSFMARMPAGIDHRQVEVLFREVLAEWYDESTLLYRLVIGCLDLSGPMQEVDLQHITVHYHFGNHRLGKDLLAWALSFRTDESVEGQIQLSEKVMRLEISGTPSLPTFTCHVTSLLQNWCKISGNSISQPQSFYHHLLRPMSKASDGSKLSMIKLWAAQKITDREPILSDPDMFIRTLVRHAEHIGLPADTSSINFMNNQNKCGLCTSTICENPGNKKEFCLCFNPSKNIPKKATAGQINFINEAREYIAKTACTTLKG
eukprot:6381886-Prymnesium_polylepis.1